MLNTKKNIYEQMIGLEKKCEAYERKQFYRILNLRKMWLAKNES